MPEFPPITHVAVTVTILSGAPAGTASCSPPRPSSTRTNRPAAFTTRCSRSTGGQLFGLHIHPQAVGDGFDEHRTGLDHVAFACRDRDELQKWAARLDELGIAHGGIKDAHYGSGVSFRDPDGIALEFFAPPA